MLEILINAISNFAKNELKRNERVIKILKHFNIDPDHPPAEFTTVYNYALVEYGVGKSRAILELFREKNIQKSFRKAFDADNPNILIEEVEKILEPDEWNLLEEEIREENIDVLRELAEFSAVFIKVVELSRTPAEVKTDRNIANLQQELESIKQQLHQLGTLVEIRSALAKLTGTHTINDVDTQYIASNLATQLQSWFETLGYQFEKYRVWQVDYFEWIIKIQGRRRFDRILIRGIDGEATISDLLALRQSVAAQKTDEGWLVAARRISRAARDEVDKDENENLFCYTVDELIDETADFTNYINWLEAEVKKRKVDRMYVPLACTKEEFDPVTKQKMAVSRYGDRDGWIDGYVDLWIDDPAKEHLSILGEFGTGKTWFTFHYAYTALLKYKEAKERGLTRPRLPLVILLRDYAKALNVENVLAGFFFTQHNIRLNSEVFEQLNRMGKLLLIFDGFDEMAAKVDKQQMINNFWELAKVVVPGAKVILTCRTEHFPEARQGRALLNAELKASIANLTGETPQFEVLELEKFDDEQIRQVLSFQAQTETVVYVMGNSQLLDLARRPVMSDLIIEALPDIEAGKPVDMSRVYLYAVRRKMERDIKSERTFTSLVDKMYFLCELAWEMLSTEQMSLNYRLFPDRIRRLFGSTVEEQKDLDHWHYDMMAQTMLVRNADGDYTPAHRSLLEFFVAYKFAGELGVLADDFVEVVRNQFGDNQKTIAQQFSPTESRSQQFSDTESSPQQFSDTESRSQQFSDTESRSQHFSETESLPQQFSETESLPQQFSDTESRSQQFCESESRSQHFSETESRSQQFSETDSTTQQFSPTESRSQQFCESESRSQHFSETESRSQHFSETESSSQQFCETESRSQHFSETESSSQQFCETESSTQQFSWGEYFQHHVDGKGEILALEKIKLFKTESLEKLKETFGRSLLTKAVLDLLVGMVDKRNGIEKLLGVIEATKGKSEAEVGYVGGNAATVLVKVDNTALENKDLSATVIKGANFSDASLCHVKFQKTTLAECKFTRAFGLVISLAFSPDDKLLVTGGGDGEICLWEVESGKQISSFRAHNYWVHSVAFSPNGTIIASCSHSGGIKLWDPKTGKCLIILGGHTDKAREISFNSNGTILASCSDDKIVKLWDVSTGECVKTLLGHTSRIWAVAIAPSNQILASGSFDYSIKIWDIASGNCLKTLQEHRDGIVSIAFSQDSKLLVSASLDRNIKLWDINAGKSLKNLIGHTNHIRSLAFSKDNKTIYSASYDHTIKMWSINNGECLKTIKGHNGRVQRIALNSTNTVLASCSDDQTIKLWDTNTGDCLQTFQGCTHWVQSVIITPDGKTIISGNNNQTIKFWNINTGDCFKTFRGHYRWIASITISPDGKQIASGSGDRTIKIWDINTGNCLKTLNEHELTVSNVVFNPDGLTLASSSFDKNIKLWEINTGKCLKTFQGHSDWVNSVIFSRDGKIIVSASDDRTIKLWDVSTGKCIRTLLGHDSRVLSVDISPDGITLASGSQDRRIKIWNIHTGECLKTFQEKDNYCGIKSVKFNYSGLLLAAGNIEQTIKIWHIPSGKCLKTLKGHKNRVTSVAFTPDDKFLVSGSYDETIKIWNIKTGKCIKTLSNKPYTNMNITGATGLTPEQKSSLKALGAVEE